MTITQLEKARFIKVIEAKLTEVELFKFFPFMCVATTGSKYFCMAHLVNSERFLYHSYLSFKVLNVIYM